MRKSHHICLLLLVKYPQKGYVKTRLTRELDPYFVSELYKHIVEDVISSIGRTQLPLCIYYTPTNLLPSFQTWLGTEHLFLPQKGKHLGSRLQHGVQSLLQSGFTSVIALASDVPDLSSNILRTAANALDHSDLVIGPCNDGGYYLIGFTNNSYHPKYFTNIPWSTSEVFAKTLNIAKQTGVTTNILPRKQDIDTLHDLQTFIHAQVKHNSSSLSRTASYIYQNLNSIYG